MVLGWDNFFRVFNLRIAESRGSLCSCIQIWSLDTNNHPYVFTSGLLANGNLPIDAKETLYCGRTLRLCDFSILFLLTSVTSYLCGVSSYFIVLKLTNKLRVSNFLEDCELFIFINRAVPTTYCASCYRLLKPILVAKTRFCGFSLVDILLCCIQLQPFA